MLEYSLFWLKPDVFDRDSEREEWSKLKIALPKAEDFIEEIKQNLRERGLEIIKEKKALVSRETALAHYEEHSQVFDIKDKISKQEFLARYMTSDNSYWIIFYGENAIKVWREVLKEIRNKYLETPQLARKNMTHASDSVESATREIKLHFSEFIFNF